MDFDLRDTIWRPQSRRRGSRVVRHKNQKSFRTCADADGEPQASNEESYADSVTYSFAKTEGTFAHSIAKSDRKQINAQERIPDSRTNRIPGCDRDIIPESGREADAFASAECCFWKEGLAQRKPLPR
jgi:hypothetical protein